MRKIAALASIVVGVLSLALTAFPAAQSDAPYGTDKVTILGNALNMSNTATGANQTIRINIDRWSTPSQRQHRSEEHTSELQSQSNLVCRLLLEKKKKKKKK